MGHRTQVEHLPRQKPEPSFEERVVRNQLTGYKPGSCALD
jgi:hypothetical protein